MHLRRSLAGVLAATAFALVLAVSASANHLSSSATTFRAVWAHMETRFSTESTAIRCPMTIEGTLHAATMSKVAGALIGYVTRASLSSAACTGGEGVLAAESLPWHLEYERFAGTLPSISAMEFQIVNPTINLIPIGGSRCTARAEARHPLHGRVSLEAGRITSIEASASGIPLTGEGLCSLATDEVLASASTVTTLGTSTAITVRLI